MSNQTIANVAILVPDYDQAIAYYTKSLGFELVEDSDLGNGKRWVLVSPAGSIGTRLLLAKATTPDQCSRIGNQTGGRVFLFLLTNDFERDYKHMLANGVRFIEEPRLEQYGRVVVFEDLYGNKWDLVQKLP